MELLRQNADSKFALDAEQTIDRLSREVNWNSVSLDNVSLGEVKALKDRAITMDAVQLEKWAAELPFKSTEQKKAAALFLTDDAIEQNRGNQKHVLGAALQADYELTSKIAENRLNKMNEQISSDSGDIAGIVGTMLFKKGAERVLESASSFLPSSALMKMALSLGGGLAFGGIANNYAAGREILNTQGLYRNSALSGLMLIGSYAAGPVIFPTAMGSVWQRAEHAYIISNVGLANYSIIDQLGQRIKAENLDKSLATAKWQEKWRLQKDYMSH